MKASHRTHANATTQRVWIAKVLLAALLACMSMIGCDAFETPHSLQQRRQRHAVILPKPPNPTTTRTRLRLGGNPDDDADTTTIPQSDNPFASLLASILPKTAPSPPVETEAQREERLKLERQQEIEALEAKRQDQIQMDAPVYLLLLSLQLLPLVGTDYWVNKLYFLGTAITTVYLGSRQKTVFAPETVSRKSALGAPIGASVAIGLLYALIKFGFDPTTGYAVLVTIYGILGIADIGAPLLRGLLEEAPSIPVPAPIVEALALEEREVPLPNVLAPALGVLATAVYWSPALAMEQKFLVSNLIAWSIGMASLGVISLGSFQTGAILLGGLFFYGM